MNSLEFFQALYGSVQSGYLNIWTLPDKRSMYFKAADFASAARYAESRFESHDVYFGVGLRREKLMATQRGGNEDVCAVPAFWTDIDIAGSAHKETALPETADEALDFLNALPLKPSIVVHSGNDLHVYWLFEKPLGIATEAHRTNIQNALRGWQQHINDAARECGWKLDNTSDLSRVLRVPGGVNHKAGGNGERAVIIAENDVRYAPSDFASYIPRQTKPDAPPNIQSDTAEKFTGTTGEAARIFEKCAFLRHCCDNAATLTEPYWYTNSAPIISHIFYRYILRIDLISGRKYANM